MEKFLKISLLILNFIAAITFYMLSILSLQLLLKPFNFSLFLECFLYFGLGTLSYRPLKYILNN